MREPADRAAMIGSVVLERRRYIVEEFPGCGTVGIAFSCHAVQHIVAEGDDDSAPICSGDRVAVSVVSIVELTGFRIVALDQARERIILGCSRPPLRGIAGIA